MDLLNYFFTHKDFLPPADQLPGTLFTPLHFATAGVLLALTILAGLWLSQKSEKTIKRVFCILWIFLVILELSKIVWETVSGRTIHFELTGVLPLYPCSVFMYAMPLVLSENKLLRHMGCGYVCSLGLLGGIINFFYPANVLNRYSCLSFAGLQTLIYHAALVFFALVMLKSGYHSYRSATKAWHLVLPVIPTFVVSLFANMVNFSPVNSDYMFFKLNSFFFAPIGAALPPIVSVILVYLIYLLIHSLPYLPFYFINKKRSAHETT
jgi:hypothetical protein